MITSDLFNNKKFVAEAIGDLGSKRDQGKSIRRWRKSRGLDEQGVAEGKADPVGSWVVYDGGKVKRFKSREGAKAYAEKNGGKVASSEFYADNIQSKQAVKENASGGASSAGGIAVSMGGPGYKPTSGVPKKIGNAHKTKKVAVGKGIY